MSDTMLYSAFASLLKRLRRTYRSTSEAALQRNKIVKWPEFENLQNLLSERLAYRDKRAPDPQYLQPILAELGMKCINLDDESSHAEYSELERSLRDPFDGSRVWCYLQHFDCTEDIINLRGPLQIRKATLVERATFREQRHYLAGSSLSFIAETKTEVAEPMLQTGKQDSSDFTLHITIPDSPPFGDEFYVLVTILRLIKPSSVGFNLLSYHICRENVKADAGYQPRPEAHPCTLGVRGHSICSLDSKDVETLKMLWNEYRSAVHTLDDEDAKRLKRSLRRYDTAICSNEIEDAIVDLIIALETILKTGGHEMTHYASYLIGTNEDARNKLQGILGSARRMRNVIVHGGSLRDNNEKVKSYLLSIVGRILTCAILLAGREEWLIGLVKAAIRDDAKLTELHGFLSDWLVR